VITAALLAAGLCAALFGRSLSNLSGNRLNAYLRKRGMRPVSNRTLDDLDNCAGLLGLLEELLRLGALATLTAAVLRGGLSLWSALALYAALGVFFLVFLEALPGAVARTASEKVVGAALGPLRFLGRSFAPFVQAYEKVEGFFVRAGGGDVEKQAEQAVEDEILSAAEEGEREGVLETGGREMIESIIRFYDVEVREVMTPRTSMVCMDAALTLPEGVKVATACGHSRIPVYKENKDNIVGILYVKDLLQYVGTKEWEEKRIGQVVRKAYFVPESKKISRLFQEFRTQRFHIAVVLDEYGGTSGLVTIEDILEEIVGEIADEYELQKGGAPVRNIDEQTAEADAGVHIDELNERLGLEVPEDGSYETLAGFLFTQFGRIPQIGERLNWGNVVFEVIDADERRIKKVRIRRENLS